MKTTKKPLNRIQVNAYDTDTLSREDFRTGGPLVTCTKCDKQATHYINRLGSNYALDDQQDVCDNDLLEALRNLLGDVQQANAFANRANL